jgi:S1-C subfamily serine protease
MENRRFAVLAGLGCLAAVLIGTVVAIALLVGPVTTGLTHLTQDTGPGTVSTMAQPTRETVAALPTMTPILSQPERNNAQKGIEPSSVATRSLASLYQAVNPGVVNIRVYIARGGMTGQGAGSGFLIDDAGHIVTNDHVVAQAERVTVIFYNGFEARAEVVGTDPDSDLAVIKAEDVAQGAHPLPIAGPDAVVPGDWVVAIGNPFSLGSSMSLGIVSAVGRTIPAAETPFNIPQAIQTDAAINPGNSGGPLLNLEGQVVGVNAQIRSSTGANSGVGFAIPSDVVHRVAPALIEKGTYVWPWLGVTGGSVNLLLQEANELNTQEGAYIASVAENGPAEKAGLRGTTGEQSILGQNVPVGGDVVVEADGQSIRDFADLLTYVAFKQPGGSITLTVLRDGKQQQVTVELAARPENLNP